MQILVIDDDELIRLMLRRLLRRAGYDVLMAANGQEGIDLFREHRPQVVITDLIMPDKEGIETIIELHRESAEVKIIAISGGGRLDPREYLAMAKGMGAHYTFTKPFEPKDILAAVRDLLEA